MGELRLEKLQVAPQKNDAQGLALPAQLNGVGHLVGVLVQVVEVGVLPRVLQKLLAAFHQIGEEHVHGALDDDGDGGAGLLLEMAGVGVGLEALLGHHGHHLPAGLLGDVGVVVEHAGHGGHAYPGQPGNVFDGHSRPSCSIDYFTPLPPVVATLFLRLSPLPRRRPRP